MQASKEYWASKVVNAAFEVHKNMGPGLLESVYETCMLKEFELQNIPVYAQVPVPIIYKGQTLDKDYRIDLLVGGEVLVELKAVEYVLPVHHAQLLSYLKLTDKQVGFLINFNVPLIKNGIKRFVNNYEGV
ncbi:GxxExxY protein [Arcticibacterium luteifluviistationis]|uniref:GxxExxY protein n=1 Tax=Arcticibacterium luteifluviistationis TaxID=1784714 RepID=A0A2Z4GAE1_9BACT|nr:GxxExxY protein [Arcticibacterium luteifluviistationis]AWV98176.1 GxxExxY protein [Arcticibacterium luteifluviistationis]